MKSTDNKTLKPTRKQRVQPSVPITKTDVVTKSPENSGNAMMFKLLWYIVLALTVFIFIKQTSWLDEEGNSTDSMEFSLSGFLSGDIQKKCESQLLNKPFFVDMKKTKNEYEFKLFGKVNLDENYLGKEGYIFGESMTRASFGDDFIGEEAIKREVNKAKFVQTKLHEAGIELLILFAPGKSTIYKEFLPDAIAKTKMKITNSRTYIEECKAQEVNHIDFIEFFSVLKRTNPYPLFSQYGSHWSYYGECIAVDTTIRRLERLLNTNLPNIIYNNVQLMDTALVRDADIFRKMPMHKMPHGKLLAYPQNIGYEQGVGVSPQKIIAIGDSYFRGFFYLGAMDNAFGGSQQWYYNNSIIPEAPGNPEVWELDLKKEILKNKAIVILCNEMNLKTLGNGFIDEAYFLFSNESKYNVYKMNRFEINTLKKQIRNDKELLDKLTVESHSRLITLDSLITETAIKRKSTSNRLINKSTKN